MLVLGIETSSPRGSVALWDGEQILVELTHQQPNAHAEKVSPLVDELIEVSGRSRRELSRVGVGIGPGSFTGLRVGIALAQGIATGLGLPLVGVQSTLAMANQAALNYREYEVFCPVLDARRDEVFFAAFARDGEELRPVSAIGTSGLEAHLRTLGDPSRIALCGEFAKTLAPKGYGIISAPETEYPQATAIARLAAATSELPHDVTPQYVRQPDAVLPKLPPNPLASQT